MLSRSSGHSGSCSWRTTTSFPSRSSPTTAAASSSAASNRSRQKYPLKEIVIVDNASTDGTIDILEQFEDRCQIYYNEENIGFAAAQNQAIELSSGDWVLTLNPDVLLLPNFIQALVDAGQFDPQDRHGLRQAAHHDARTSIFPKSPWWIPPASTSRPCCGIWTAAARKWITATTCNYEYVFGATAAAALYRREMIEDISLDGEFFDSDFFVYREDADVAWRAQLMGWKCLYAPLCPRLSRAQRAAGQSPRAAARDQHALGEEPVPDAHQEHVAGSLPAQLVLHHGARSRGGDVLPAVGAHFAQGLLVSGAELEARDGQAPRDSMQRRRVDDEYMASWFQFEPVSKPAPKKMRRAAPRAKPRAQR